MKWSNYEMEQLQYINLSVFTRFQNSFTSSRTIYTQSCRSLSVNKFSTAVLLFNYLIELGPSFIDDTCQKNVTDTSRLYTAKDCHFYTAKHDLLGPMTLTAHCMFRPRRPAPLVRPTQSSLGAGRRLGHDDAANTTQQGC